MIASDHYDDEILVAIAEDRAEQDTDPHLSGCEECRTSVEQYRSMISCLGDEAMWSPQPLDETPNPRTIATLRSYVDQMQREDAEAEPLVAALLAGPREEWMPRLMGDEKYRTAGVVRKLIAAMPSTVRSRPHDALAISAIATAIAEMLLVSGYGEGSVQRLRGSAWRENGFAAFYVGEHGDALQAVATSFSALSAFDPTDHELARLKILNALLCRENDNLATGIRQLDEAAAFFESSGQINRLTSALMAKASLLSKAGDFAAASQSTELLLSEYAADISDEQRASLHANLGYFYREQGDLPRALQAFEIAAFMLDELHMTGDAIRTRWNVALTLERAGKLDDALNRLDEVASQFESLGMNGAATLAALDAAQIHVAREEYEAVDSICHRAIEQFRRTGLATSSRALTAIALLREASQRRQVSVDVLQNVAACVRSMRHEFRLHAPSPSE